MPLMSPGGGLTWFSQSVTVTTFLLLLTVNLCSGGPSDKASETVVIQIANIKQPENCSLFLTSLEELLSRTSDYSSQLNQASHLRHFAVEVPLGWDFSLCSGRGERQGTYSSPPSRPDILLGSSHPVFGSHPWTLQNQGCGKRGLLINLPQSFVQSTSLDSHVRGCSPDKKEFWQFCGDSEDYQRESPSKQNIQCNARSAAEVIASSCPGPVIENYVTVRPPLPGQLPTVDISSQSQQSAGLPGSRQDQDQQTVPQSHSVAKREEKRTAISFSYLLPASTKYNIILDQTANMEVNMRWTNIKRALFRFINLLPVGSRLNIHSVGDGVKEVLPSTTVTETNRDGLFGRIPRRVLEDASPCVSCGLSKVIDEMGANEVVLVITGDQGRLHNQELLVKQVEARSLPVYVISYPPTLHTSYLNLATFGQVYSVLENSESVRPLIHLQEIFANIVTKIENEIVEKIHETHYNSLGFAGTFTFEKEESAELLITLNVPDEEKVELFEVKDPSGKKRIFSKFEDGMVYFKFNGLLPPGIWSYHAKLYHDSLYPDTKMTVDVITKCDQDTGIVAEVFTSLSDTPDQTVSDAQASPVIVFARVMAGGLPVLKARVTVDVYLPGEFPHASVGDTTRYQLELRDDGYPDITSSDGIYSSYIPRYAVMPGYYSLRLTATDNNGRAQVPKGQTKDVHTGTECCGSVIDFGNKTSPTGTFTRITSGPAFYVSKGYSLTKDISPPSRIPDFSLLTTDLASLSISLTWSAPGGDYDTGKAHRYEIRCHTSQDMLGEENFGSKGILVHADTLPVPGQFGARQTCNASIPWTNQIFYYAIVAFDEKGNRGPISNMVTVYIHEPTTTTTVSSTTPDASTLDPYIIIKYLKNKNFNNESFDDEEKFLRNISENLVSLERSSSEVYMAVGIVCGVVTMIVILLISVVLISRRKRPVTPSASTTTSHTSQDDNGSTHHLDTGKLTKVSKVSPDGSSKVLLSWLESLPKSDSESLEPMSPPSPHTSHNNSLDSAANTINRRNQTLTRTNPYRHKMLTNGSFVSLKDIPTGSDEGSTRLTTSTVDDSNSSDTSSGSSYNNVGLTSKSIKDPAGVGVPGQANIKRSNTSAAQLANTEAGAGGAALRRSHNTGYYSFRDYSPVYGTATLGRGATAYKNNLSVLAEDEMNGTMKNNSRRTKRTESFV